MMLIPNYIQDIKKQENINKKTVFQYGFLYSLIYATSNSILNFCFLVIFSMVKL